MLPGRQGSVFRAFTAVTLLAGTWVNAQSFHCSATQLCPNNLCCNAKGWCTSTADACLASAGCQSQCRTIPSPTAVCGSNNSSSGNSTNTTNGTVLMAQSLATSQTQKKLQLQQLQTITEPYFGKSLTIDPVVDTKRDANCTYRYELQPCELLDIMGGPDTCPYCLYYYEHIKEATQMFDLDCPIRLASFLGQIRHETMSLQQLWQPIDNGAGAIHIIPANFHLVIKGVPRLLDDFSKEFPQLSPDLPDIVGNAAQQIDVAAFLMRPEHAFLTAGWWYVKGAQSVLSQNGCEDLRAPADVGLGARGAPVVVSGVSRPFTSGFFEVSRCIFGDGADPGLTQRQSYYQAARNVTDTFQKQAFAPGDGPPAGPPPAGDPDGVFGPKTGIIVACMSIASVFFLAFCIANGWQRYKSPIKEALSRRLPSSPEKPKTADEHAEQGLAKPEMSKPRDSVITLSPPPRRASAAGYRRDWYAHDSMDLQQHGSTLRPSSPASFDSYGVYPSALQPAMPSSILWAAGGVACGPDIQQQPMAVINTPQGPVYQPIMLVPSSTPPPRPSPHSSPYLVPAASVHDTAGPATESDHLDIEAGTPDAFSSDAHSTSTEQPTDGQRSPSPLQLPQLAGPPRALAAPSSSSSSSLQ